MVGPFKTGASGFTHSLIAVDKFTKWIEAKPIKNLGAGTAISFIRELIFRYEVPHNIITDNGSNFDSDKFRAFSASVRTPIPSHIDLAGNTSYHIAASRTVSPRVSPYHGPGPFAPFGSRI